MARGFSPQPDAMTHAASTTTTHSRLYRALGHARTSGLLLTLGCQRIAVSVYGVNEAGALDIGFDLLSQPRDCAIDAAGQRRIGTAPDLTKQLITMNDLTVALSEIVASDATYRLILERGQQDWDSEYGRFPRLFRDAD